MESAAPMERRRVSLVAVVDTGLTVVVAPDSVCAAGVSLGQADPESCAHKGCEDYFAHTSSPKTAHESGAAALPGMEPEPRDHGRISEIRHPWPNSVRYTAFVLTVAQ